MGEDRFERFFGLVPELEVAHVVVGSGRQLSRVGQTERAVDRLRDIHDIGDLRLDAALLNEDVSVVLMELLNAEQAVELARFLFSVDDVGLRIPYREFAVGTLTAAEHVDRVRAVHRLHRVRRILVGRDDEHAVLIVIPVTARDPKLLFGQDGARDLLIVVQPVLAAPVFEKRVVERPAAGQEVRHARRSLVEHKELHFAAEFLVVPTLRFLDAVEVLFQLVLRRERHAVDAAEHFVVRVAAPVSARRGRQFERLDGAGREEVRPGAEVGEVALTVEGDLLALRQIADKLDLVGLFPFLHERDGFIARESIPLEADILLDDLLHLALDLFEIFRLERFLHVKVVVEALLDRGPDSKLHFREQTLDRLREDMRRRVPEGVTPLRVVEREKLRLRVRVEYMRQLDGFPADRRGENAEHRQLRPARRLVYRQRRLRFVNFVAEVDPEHIIPP